MTKHQLMADWLPLISIVVLPMLLITIYWGVVILKETIATKKNSLNERNNPGQTRVPSFGGSSDPKTPRPPVNGIHPLPSSVAIGERMSLFALFWAVVIGAGLYTASLFAEQDAKKIPEQLYLLWRVFISADDRTYTYTILTCFLFGAIYLYEIYVDFNRIMDPYSENNSPVMLKLKDGSITLDDLKDARIAIGYLGERAAVVLRSLDEDPSGGQAEQLVGKIMEADEDACVRAFVAVQWTEAALPILGFIGTALHYGLTLPLLTKALGTASQPGMNDSLGQALSNMAIAFDTTLLGLFFLLIVGLCHSKVRKFLDWSLANTKETLLNLIFLRQTMEGIRFSQEIEGLQTRFSQEIAGLQTVLLQQVAVFSQQTALMLEVNHRLDSCRRIESLVQTMIEEGNTEFWKEFKRVVYSSFVEFGSSDEAHLDKRDAFLDETIGKDRYIAAVGMGFANQGTVGLAAIRQQKDWHFLRFYVDHNSQFPTERVWKLENPAVLPNVTAIYFNESKSVALALLDKGGAASIMFPPNLGEKSCLANCRPWIPDGYNIIKCLPMTLGEDVFLFALVGKAGGHQIRWNRVTEEPLDGLFEELDFKYTWKKFALDNYSRTVFIAGKSVSDGRWALRRIPIDIGKDSKSRIVPAAKDNSLLLWRNLPLNDEDIAFLTAISENRAIVVDSSGRLWDVAFNLPEPLPMSQNQTGTWSRGARLFPGFGDCLAVVSDSNLTLWNSRRLGCLRKDKNYPSFAVGDADPETFQTSANRCHLVAVSNNKIMTWHFPQATIDG